MTEQKRRRAPVCGKPITDRCARPETHTGECRCPHADSADALRLALGNLIEDVLSSGAAGWGLRKAARIARYALNRAWPPKGGADFAREDRERRAADLARRAERERDRAVQDPEAAARGEDARFGHQELFRHVKAALPELEALLAECSGHWGYEDMVYRFYHGSFKVYWVQESTRKIVAALQSLAPGHSLNPWFIGMVEEGTGRAWTAGDNARWLEVTRPMLEAFFHARFLLEMAVRYGRKLEAPPMELPSGWAALLELYALR